MILLIAFLYPQDIFLNLLDKEGNPVYLDFRNILDYFDEDDTFIFNDTQVFPARLCLLLQ